MNKVQNKEKSLSKVDEENVKDKDLEQINYKEGI